LRHHDINASRRQVFPARENEMKALEIGGLPDHVHVLLSLSSTICVAKALQLLKGGSFKWVHDTFPEHRLFGWQAKYGAFSVSVSLLDKTIEYIKSQQEHHRKMTFQEEFLALLKRHRIAYDERYLWE
jgi:putative transposase